MADTIIQVNNLSKNYIISHESGTRANASLGEIITQRFKNLFSSSATKSETSGHTSEQFWALQDINFEIERGSRVGILGSNGAGKSTLLKILSKIIEPSQGTAEVKGHVVSLLEVGTGFHPELTGRENVFLNGVILGMSRAEIRKKFDEIVEFAEVEKFLDTPVKRYSSGMYMRLAFSVAAHLEPEILIIDEVLAVGDARFQKKCLAKMDEISRGDGRTVLFVSHNIDAVRSFCNTGIYLNGGKLVMQGDIESVADKYASYYNGRLTSFKPNDHKAIYFNAISVNKPAISFNSEIVLSCEVISNSYQQTYIIGITITDSFDNKVGSILLNNKEPLKKGNNQIHINVPFTNVVPGDYKFIIALALDESLNNEDVVWEYPGFTITSNVDNNHFMIPKWHHSWGAHIMPDISFMSNTQASFI
jgi:lipopolysaccharide transport system ATP-binding protein